MPRRNGHNRKRYVITCQRCKVQFRSAMPNAKYHSSCRSMEYQDRQKEKAKRERFAPPKVDRAAQAPVQANKFNPSDAQLAGQVTFKTKAGDRLGYPVFDHHGQHIIQNGNYIYTDGKDTYRITPGQYEVVQKNNAERERLRAEIRAQRESMAAQKQVSRQNAPAPQNGPKKSILARLRRGST